MQKLIILGNRIFQLNHYGFQEINHNNIQNYNNTSDVFYLAKLPESLNTITLIKEHIKIRQLLSLEYILSSLEKGDYSGSLSNSLFLNIVKNKQNVQISMINIDNSNQSIAPLISKYINKIYIHPQLLLFYCNKYINIVSLFVLVVLIYYIVGINII